MYRVLFIASLIHLIIIGINGQGCVDVVDIQQQGTNSSFTNGLVIVPEYNFSCNGRITGYLARLELNVVDSGEYPTIQIWHPVAQNSTIYCIVGNVCTLTANDIINITTNESSYYLANVSCTGSNRTEFQSGDVIGYYQSNSSHSRLLNVLTEGYTSYRISSSLSNINISNFDALRSIQPLIQVMHDIQCDNLLAPANGEITSCSSGRVGVGYEGDTCSFTCNTGYELTGNGTKICRSDGSWSSSDDTYARNIDNDNISSGSWKSSDGVCIRVCYAPLSGQVDCGNGLVNMGFEGDNCNFSCDPGYMLQGNVTSGTCKNNGNWNDELLFSGSGSEELPFSGSWSGGLPSCVPLNCSKYTLPVPANATVLQLPSCGPAYQSQCTVSCEEGFTGDNVTYLCNVTSDPSMVDWMVLNRTEIDQKCEGVPCPNLTLENGMVNCSTGNDGVPSYGDSCSFSCNDGYYFTGPETRFCESNGMWSGNETLCEKGKEITTLYFLPTTENPVMSPSEYDMFSSIIMDGPTSEISPTAVMYTDSSTPVSINTTSSTATLAMNTSGTIMIVSVTASSANNTIDMTSVTSTTGAVSINSIATTDLEMSTYSSTPSSASTNSNTATPTMNASGTIMIVSVTDSSANNTIDMTSVTSTTSAVSINGIVTTNTPASDISINSVNMLSTSPIAMMSAYSSTPSSTSTNSSTATPTINTITYTPVLESTAVSNNISFMKTLTTTISANINDDGNNSSIGIIAGSVIGVILCISLLLLAAILLLCYCSQRKMAAKFNVLHAKEYSGVEFNEYSEDPYMTPVKSGTVVYENGLNVSDYETPFVSNHYKDNDCRSNEVTPYSVPQDAISKNLGKVKTNDYEPLPDSAEYASAFCVYVNTMRESLINEDISGLDYAEVSDIDPAANDEDEVFSDPGHSEADVYACLEKKRFRKIKTDDISISQKLGSGEFGTVHLGLWSNGSTDPVQVAVKTLNSQCSESDRVKFLREAAIMGQFEDDYIVQLHGVVTAMQNPMILLEYMPKGDLNKCLMNLRKTTPPEALNELKHDLLSYCRHVSAGLSHLSRKGFVHRDLAARNILVSSDDVCKIGDFGMARDVTDDACYVSGGGKIPIKWTAPEALFYKKYSAKSDVWSFGCVMYEIWSLGHKPFEDLSGREYIHKITTGYRLPPPPGCPRAMYELMIQCWNPLVNERVNPCMIFKMLQKSDRTLLPSAMLPRDNEELSTILGDPLTSSTHLYLELQNAYQ